MRLLAEGEQYSQEVWMHFILVQDLAHQFRRDLQRLDGAF
jgi:hypothetical protein